MVPGREIAGIVSAVGSSVTKLAGEEQYCLRGNVGTYGGTLDGRPTDGGYSEYYATSDDATFETLAGTFDLIINTVSAPLPMGKYLRLLSLDGTVVSVGAPPEPLEVPAFALIMGRKSWAGSAIGGIRETQEMLDLCAEHHIGAEIELIEAAPIDQAWERVVGSDVRHRFVIDAATFA